MPCYLCQEEMIAFDSPGAGRKQPGVRFDVDFDGMVAVDASAHPKLDADDCRTLAGWLLRQADRMSQAPAAAAKPAKTAKPRGRGRPCKFGGAS